jgi:hypothetical protein
MHVTFGLVNSPKGESAIALPVMPPQILPISDFTTPELPNSNMIGFMGTEPLPA